MQWSHSADEYAGDVLGQHEFARIDLHHKAHQMNRRIANIPGNSLLKNSSDYENECFFFHLFVPFCLFEKGAS